MKWCGRSFRRALACVGALAVAAASASACSSSSGAPPDEVGGADSGVESGSMVEPPAFDGASPLDSQVAAQQPDGAGAADADTGPPMTGLAPAPTLTTVTPSQAVVGTSGPTIVCNGTNFVPRSVVQVDGVALATSYVSSTELRATIPTSSMGTVGELHVTVGTSPPGGGGSAEVAFEVVNPAPVLTALSPTSALLGAGDTALTVTGMSFVTGATLSFGGMSLPTTITKSTSATATIPAASLVASGSFPIIVTNPAPGGGASSSIAFVVANPTVTVTSVTPGTLDVGAPDTAIALTGTGYVSASAVSFNGQAIATTFVDATHLTATVPAASLATAGDFPVAVTNPAPGGGVSTPFTVHVDYAAASAASLAPASALVAAPPPTVTVTGGGFLPGASVVAFDGAPALTTFVDSSHVSATMTTQQMAAAHIFKVTVSNPTPGGGASAPLTFTVANPVPVATSLSPSFALVGAGATAVHVSGSGFLPTSQVMLGSLALATSYTSATSLGATIPASNLASSATLALSVANPAPGGGTSSPLSFVVDYPGPSVTSIAPASAIVPGADTAITVSGTGFVTGASVVQLGGATLATSYSGGALGAVIPAAQLASAGTLSITVANPAPGGGTSNAVFFTATDPAPSITSIAPATIPAGSAATAVTITGTGFVAASTVTVGGSPVAVTAQTATTLAVTLPATLLVAPTTLSVTVSNPAPGGGTSAPATITVSCNTSGADVVLSSLSAIQTLSLDFTSAPTALRITTSQANDLCPSTTASSTTKEPYLGFVVVNATAQAATLSAWAVCSSTDDAFLTFYSRSTVPSTQAELEACTGYIAEGSDGAGQHTSPSSGSSLYCPGLMKANGDGLSIASCGRAVVLVQPYSVTDKTFTPPTTLKIELQ